MAFKLKSGLNFGQKSAFKMKNYSPIKQNDISDPPQKPTDDTYADGTKKSSREQDFSKRHSQELLKEWLIDKRGFDPVEADQMISTGAYTLEDMVKDINSGDQAAEPKGKGSEGKVMRKTDADGSTIEIGPIEGGQIAEDVESSPNKQGDPSDLTQEELDAMPPELFDNPHDLGPGGNKKVIDNLNRDKWRDWYAKSDPKSPKKLEKKESGEEAKEKKSNWKPTPSELPEVKATPKEDKSKKQIERINKKAEDMKRDDDARRKRELSVKRLENKEVFEKTPLEQEGPIDKQNPKLEKSEHPDTWIYPGEIKSERIADLEDRIGFIKEDIFNERGDSEQQNKDIAKLEQELAILRKSTHPNKMKKSPNRQVAPLDEPRKIKKGTKQPNQINKPIFDAPKESTAEMVEQIVQNMISTGAIAAGGKALGKGIKGTLKGVAKGKAAVGAAGAAGAAAGAAGGAIGKGLKKLISKRKQKAKQRKKVSDDTPNKIYDKSGKRRKNYKY